VPQKINARHRFARNLRKIRKTKGFSQEKLAELANLHRTYIGSVERGERNVTIDSMERISIALGASIETLLGEEEGNDSPSR
jgi:transcriptional regulator with XRE-family HTH domain